LGPNASVGRGPPSPEFYFLYIKLENLLHITDYRWKKEKLEKSEIEIFSFSILLKQMHLSVWKHPYVPSFWLQYKS
jgi:hypothetical protein